ncbi:MAG: hypothetical protein GF317_13770 [Candidatus Lokiarchaeota archaeon]|nr:hypothetical protein [Candidatus Lokiarchaeota archaeon]MBD3200695.1 hypothetical protein [Candidatus Lokiarchaeota archaeon]
MSQGESFRIEIQDGATFPEALAVVDKQVKNNPEKSIFPLSEGYIHNYLQLVWNPQTNKIYEDIGIMAYGPHKEFMPLHDNPDFSLIPNSEIAIQIDPGC